METEYQNDYIKHVNVKEMTLSLHFYITGVNTGYLFISLFMNHVNILSINIF